MAAPTAADIQAGVPAHANIIKRVPNPAGGEYLLDSNGGVYAIGGAQYGGSYHDDSYVGAQHRNDPNRQFSDLVLDPRGGYRLVSQTGENYDLAPEYQKRFGASTPPNPLAQDPAWAAFLRTSGLEYDQAAGDIARRSSAINTALGLDIPDIEEQGKKDRRGIDSNFEARGVYESGQRLKLLGEQEAHQARQLGRRQLAAGNQIGGLESDLADTVARIQRRGAELGSSIAGTQYGSELESGLASQKTKYEDDLAAISRQRQRFGG